MMEQEEEGKYERTREEGRREVGEMSEEAPKRPPPPPPPPLPPPFS